MTTGRTKPPLGLTLRDFLAFTPAQKINHRSVAGCPPGDGGPVLVMPGILHDDRQTQAFRDGLKMLEYNALGWELGRNLGPTARLMEGTSVRLSRVARDYGPVRLVGFSMGGLFARFLAQAKPHLVRQVITVCSPFADPLHSAWLPSGPAQALWRDVDLGTIAYMTRLRPPGPWAAIYSRLDGVVAWQACRDEAAMENCMEVPVRHRVAMSETAVLVAVAKCLAEPKG
jgi:pimeloyl-ACP methyl ester carboxylesterase